MSIILKSFILSFGVFGRMVLPALAISIAAGVVWSVLNVISGGYADYVSGPITATFMSLFGIRVALSLMGERDATDYRMLVLSSVLYGVFLLIVKGAALVLIDAAALLYSGAKLGGAISFRDFANAEGSLQFAFAVHAMSAKAFLSLLLYSAISVVMAVPLASAARAAGSRASSAGFFAGAGRAFVPLFCIFTVAFFLQFFFNIFALIFGFLPVFLGVVSIVMTQTLPDFDPALILKGIAASVGLLWLHSWVWAASAVALTQSEGAVDRPREAAPAHAAKPTDIRGLRKSRG